MAAATERNVKVDGLNVRYLEEGRGKPVILLHGAALGSSSDVWQRHLSPLASTGLRALAYDRPGYGRTDDAPNDSAGYQQQFVLRFMDALGIDSAGLVGHSATGNYAVQLGLDHPDRVSKLMIIGTGGLMPPLEGQSLGPPAGDAVYGREPTREEVREVLESQLYDHSIITPEILETRYQMSLGHVKAGPPVAPATGGAPRTPLWQRLGELRMPIMLLYGKDDRGSVREREPLFRQRYPNIDLRMIDNCKHLLQLDAEAEFLAAAKEFFA